MPVICVSGPDGSGKSTYARMLMEDLERRNVRCKYVWFRFNFLFSYAVLGLVHILKLKRVKILTNNRKLVFHKFYFVTPIVMVYQFSQLIDTLLFFLLKIRIPSVLGKTVICDRSVLDTLIDLMVSTRNFRLLDSLIGRLLLSLYSSDWPIIILIAKLETLKKRREDVREDENLQQKYDLYVQLAAKLNIKIIDNDGEVQQIYPLIVENIRAHGFKGLM